MTRDRDISYFAETNWRPAKRRRFGIRQRDRLFHVYLIGKTGTGKSTVLETLARQDIAEGRGLGVIDPHGDLVAKLAGAVPLFRKNDLIYLDAADPKQPYGYNPLRRIARDRIPLAASGLLEAFKKIWGSDWGVRMEHIFRNSLYALLEYGEATLPDVLRILSDKSFRETVVARVENEQVLRFWREEFSMYNPRYRQEAISPIQNKVGAFLADPRLYRILTKPDVDLRIRRILDERKIFLVNLGKGRLGEDSSNLLGALLVTTVSLAALSRTDVPAGDRLPFYLYIDEFQSYTTLSVATMVSELRKFGVGLTLAHQHLHQLELDVRHAVLGNVGTIVAFRMGPEDASLFAHEFAPTFSAEDLVNLPNYNVYLKLMVDGAPSAPFSAETLRPEMTGYCERESESQRDLHAI